MFAVHPLETEKKCIKWFRQQSYKYITAWFAWLPWSGGSCSSWVRVVSHIMHIIYVQWQYVYYHPARQTCVEQVLVTDFMPSTKRDKKREWYNWNTLQHKSQFHFLLLFFGVQFKKKNTYEVSEADNDGWMTLFYIKYRVFFCIFHRSWPLTKTNLRSCIHCEILRKYCIFWVPYAF